MTITYRRAKGASARRVGSATFLANAGRGTLYRVNSSIAALWKLLATPANASEAVDVFHAAFPSVPLGRMRADVAMMLRDLVSEGILDRVPASRTTKKASRPREGHR